MYKQDIDILLLQIKNIVLNQPLKEVPQVEDSELLKVRKAIYYLAQCVDERNTFLHHLSIGNLDTQMTSRQNLLAGSLKELHAGLKHLVWQANQVAEGDYHQRVNFLGDFSESFNRMIGQLEERKDKLRKKNDALAQYMELLIAVMEGMKEWLIVIEEDTGRIIYTDQSAKEMIYNVESEKQMCCTIIHFYKT